VDARSRRTAISRPRDFERQYYVDRYAQEASLHTIVGKTAHVALLVPRVKREAHPPRSCTWRTTQYRTVQARLLGEPIKICVPFPKRRSSTSYWSAHKAAPLFRFTFKLIHFTPEQRFSCVEKRGSIEELLSRLSRTPTSLSLEIMYSLSVYI
jgi:hypothetical protein